MSYNKIDDLEKQYDLINEKMLHLKKNYILETDPSTKFKVEKELEQAEAESDKITKELSEAKNQINFHEKEISVFLKVYDSQIVENKKIIVKLEMVTIDKEKLISYVTVQLKLGRSKQVIFSDSNGRYKGDVIFDYKQKYNHIYAKPINYRGVESRYFIDIPQDAKLSMKDIEGDIKYIKPRWSLSGIYSITWMFKENSRFLKGQVLALLQYHEFYYEEYGMIKAGEYDSTKSIIAEESGFLSKIIVDEDFKDNQHVSKKGSVEYQSSQDIILAEYIPINPNQTNLKRTDPKQKKTVFYFILLVFALIFYLYMKHIIVIPYSVISKLQSFLDFN